MGSIPVANPAPLRRPYGGRPALIALTAFLVAAVAAVVVIAFAWPENPSRPSYEWVNLGTVEELPIKEPVIVSEHRLYLVKLGSGEVLALSPRSTHLGCSVPWRPDFEFQGKMGWFRDPCSGTTWALDGSIAFGPAPRHMDRYPVALVDGNLFVDTRNRLCGDGYQYETRELLCTPPGEYAGVPPIR